jgi:TP901 family phage tail tape measure protein
MSKNVNLNIAIKPILDKADVDKLLGNINRMFADLGIKLPPIKAEGFDKFASDTKKASESAKELDKSIEDIGNEAEKTSTKASFLQKAFSFNVLNDAVNSIAGGVSNLSAPFIELDTATANMKTLGEEAKTMAPNLREAAIQMSKDLPFAAAELQTTMFDALASGVKGGEEGLKTFADTAAKLATGGGAGIGDATKLIAGQLNAYGKGAEEAAKFSDIFFNTVNYGVTSIPELSSTLANVIPTASSLGIELENVGASLAVMTSKGIPTAQSTTKLNALLIELAKPGAALAPILKQAGVSLDSLKKDDLPVTLGKVSKALKETGKASIEVFSSSEAGAAFATLAGDLEGFSQTFEDVRDTTGSAQFAYEQMADSVDVRTKQLMSSVNAFVIQGIDKLGSGVVFAAQSATQLAPIMTTVVGLGQLIPFGAIGGFAKDIAVKLLPSLFLAEGGFVGFGAAASSAWAAATAPIGLIVIAVAAVIGVLVLLYNKVEAVKNFFDTAFNAISSAISGVASVLSNLFSDSGKSSGQAFKEGFEANAQQIKLDKAKENIQNELKNAGNLTADINANFNLQSMVEEYKKSQEKINQLKTKQTGGQGLTSTEQEELKKLEKQAESTAKKLGNISPGFKENTKTFVDENGKVRESFDLNIKKVEDFANKQKTAIETKAKGSTESLSKSLLEQASVYEVQKKKLQEVADQMNKTNDPKVLANLNEEYKKQKQVVEDGGKALKTSYEESGKAGLLTKEALDKVAKSVGTTGEKAKEDFLKQAFEEASKSGELTSEKVENIAKRFNVSKEEAIKLYEEQKKQTAEAEKTAQKAKSIGDAFAEASKISADNLSKETQKTAALYKQLSDARYSGDKNRIASVKKELEEQKKIQLEADKNNDANLKATEKANKLNEEKKTASALERFNKEAELAEKTMKNEIDALEVELNKNAIAQDRKLTKEEELRLSQENLKLLQQQRATEEERISQAKKLELSALDIKNAEASINQIDKSINELTLKQRELRLKSPDLSRILAQLDRDIKAKEIEMQVKAGVTLASELTKTEVDNLTAQLQEIAQDKNSKQYKEDEKYRKELAKKEIEIKSQIAEKTRQLDEQFLNEKLAKIDNENRREFESKVASLNKERDEKLRLAIGDEQAILNIKKQYDLKKIEADKDYAKKRLQEYDNALNDSLSNSQQMARQFFSNINNDLSQGFKIDLSINKQIDDNIKQIDDEKNALKESLKNRVIDRREYFAQISQLNDKQAEEEAKRVSRMEQIWSQFSESIANSFGELAKKQTEKTNELFDKLRLFDGDNEQRIADSNKRKLQLDKEYQDSLLLGDLEKSVAIKEQLNAVNTELVGIDEERATKVNEIYGSIATNAVLSFGKMVASGKDAGKAFALMALDGLQALVPILVAQITGLSLATPDSIATFGTTGFTRAGIITALLQGVISIAKSSLQYKDGGVFGNNRKGGYLEGGRNKVLVEYNELGNEFFMNHIATAKNLHHLTAINASNISLEKYIESNKSLAMIGYKSVAKSMAINPNLIASTPKVVELNANTNSIIDNPNVPLQANIEKLSTTINELSTKVSALKTQSTIDTHFEIEADPHRLLKVQKNLEVKRIRRF